jgi:adenylate kinase
MLAGDMRILVTGTPGTGKSTLTEQLAQALSERGKSVGSVLVNNLIKSQKLFDEYDAHFDTYIIDDKKVCKFMDQHLSSIESDVCIIETHTATTLPRKSVDLVVVLTTRTDVLYDRLQARGYSADKVTENMECEIMRVVLDESLERFGKEKTLEMASNTTDDLDDNVEAILEHLGL